MTKVSFAPAGQQRPDGTPPVTVYKINIAKSCALLEAAIKAHNDKCQAKKDRVKAVHYSLAKKVLELYTNRFQRWQTSNYYSFSPSEGLPYLSINNETLSSWMVCTDRTVRNYRAKLVELGFISETVWHGSNKPFEIKINPEFLWFVNNRITERITVADGRNFPLTGSSYLTGTITGTVSGKKREPFSSQQPEPLAEVEPEQTGTQNRNEDQEQQQPVPVQELNRNTPPGCATPPRADDDLLLQRRAARALLAYSLPLLYPGKRYWSAQEKTEMEGKAALLFQGIQEINLNKVLANYSLRAKMAAFHYPRHLGVPIPPPHQFFDPEFKTGFVITRHWSANPEMFPVSMPKSAPKVRPTKPAEPIKMGQLFEKISFGQ